MGISVVIPFFNAEDYFPEALRSVLAQTLAPKEIIVVNDGCGEDVVLFLQKFPEIRAVHLDKNCGTSWARNIGIEKAVGEWIAFLDADDKWAPDKLEKQIDFLSQHQDYDGCHTGVSTFCGDHLLASYINKPSLLRIEDTLINNHVVPTSLILRKQTILDVGGFDTKLPCSEDHDLIIRLVAAGSKIGFLSEPLSFLRREEHGNLSSNGGKLILGHYYLLKKNWDTFKASPGSREIFIYKTLMTAGGKMTGLRRKLCFGFGRAFRLVMRIRGID